MYISIETVLNDEFLSLYRATQDQIIKTALPKETKEIEDFFNTIKRIVETWQSSLSYNRFLTENNILLFSLFNQITYNQTWSYYFYNQSDIQNQIIVISGTYRNRFDNKRHDVCGLFNLNENEYTLIESKSTQKIKSYSDLIEKYRTKKLILWIGRGSFYVVDKNILVLNTDYIANGHTETDNLLLSLVINNLIEKKLLTKEELITYKNKIKEFNIENQTATTNTIHYILTKTLEEFFDLDRKQKEILQNNIEIKNKKTQILIEETIKSKIKYDLDNITNQIANIEKQYQTLLNNRFELQCKQLGMNELVVNCYSKLTKYLNSQINNTITKYDLYVNNNTLNINIYTKWLPIVFMDKEMVKVTLKNNIFNEEINEYLQKYIDGECMLYTTPMKLTIQIGLLQNKLYNFDYYSNSKIPMITNGHIEYHCLGTFKLEIDKAIYEMNLAKTVALFIQYLQSVSPTDVAGQKAIRNCCIIDNNNDIIYASNNPQNYIGHNLEDYDYNEREWKRCQQ